MENIKQIKMGALYLDGTAQVNPASDYMAGAIPPYQPDAKITIGESLADRPECTITWNVVNFDGKQLLIADRALLINVSYEDLEAAGFVDGKEITLDGKKYLCRLLRCDGCNKDADEWDRALDATNDSDALWYWEDAAFWVTDLAPKSEASNRVRRGYYSARDFYLISSGNRHAYLGFRPVLEPVDSESLESDADAGCRYCKGKLRTMFAANVRTMAEDETVRDIPVPVRVCPSCGRKL